MAISEDPSIPPRDELEAEIRDTFQLVPDEYCRCFYCFGPVTHPAIYWAGETRIWLHPDCVLGLTGGLLLDVRRLRELERLRDDLRGRIGA